uniref:Uncharacterized protein n=1 Tax=Arundo donax TaxID=35708 RepID=A0A0A9EXT3_ARUDO
MLSTGFFFSAAAPEGFAAAAAAEAPFLSCDFMNHFLMSDDISYKEKAGSFRPPKDGMSRDYQILGAIGDGGGRSGLGF